MKYRKKPVVIDAWQFDPKLYEINRHLNEGYKAVFMKKVPMPSVEAFSSDDPLALYSVPSEIQYFIHTLEGDHRVLENDYIIKGIKGEFYPIKPDIFDQTYDKV